MNIGHAHARPQRREWAAILPLLVLMVWMGIAPQTFLPSIGARTPQCFRQTKRQPGAQVKAPNTRQETAHAHGTNFIPTAAEYVRILPEIILDDRRCTLIMIIEAMLRGSAADRPYWRRRLHFRTARGALARRSSHMRQPGAAFQQMLDCRWIRDVLPRARNHRRQFWPSSAPVSICGGNGRRRRILRADPVLRRRPVHHGHRQ